jgi:type III restriction enzyme
VGQPREARRTHSERHLGGYALRGLGRKDRNHIMGLRAFTSQLVCEQVVGRGLRRTSYETTRVPDPISGEEIDLDQPEYVDIFGVPFTFLPH